MQEIRTIRQIVNGQATMDGAGVKLVRKIGKKDTKDFDPFLMLDLFDSSHPADYIKGFPWHPHRGIETITYLIAGEIEHADSMGNKGKILAGDCQWMTAGSGIIHQEMPQPSKRLFGTQLWLNLPAKSKLVNPKYRPIIKQDIPTIDESGNKIHIICGSYGGYQGAIEADYLEVTYLDVELEAHSEWILESEPDHTLFICLLEGTASLPGDDCTLISEKEVILFNKGKKFQIKSLEQNVRFLLMQAPPLKEPIAWGGPIVMNTKQELSLAFSELENNTFIKK